MILRRLHWLLAALLACASLTAAAPVGAGRMLQQLESDDWIEQAEALQYLGRNGVSEARDAVRTILHDESAIPWLRGRALASLAQIERGVPAGEFGKWVAHDEPAIRAAAAEVLESHGGNSAETWINILLKDADDSVRYRAAASLASRKGNSTWPVIEPLTRNIPPQQAGSAARALVFAGTAEALQRLSEQLHEDDRRARALRGLGGIQDAKLIPIFLGLLRDLEESHLSHGMVLTLLQGQEWQEVITGLASFLQSGDEDNVRTGARIMTVLTRSPDLGKPLRDALASAKEITTIEAGLIALGSSAMKPDEHHEFFTANLTHDDSNIRSLAIRCLAHCREVPHYEVLQPSLADDNTNVVRAALGALRRQPAIDAPQGQLVHYLREPLSHEDETIRGLAYELLAHAGGEADFIPAMAVLAELLRGTDNELRAAAAKALGAIAPTEQIGDVVEAQGFIAKWMVIGTFLNDREHTAFNVVHDPEKKIDFEATYLAKYIWMVEGRHRKEDEPIEREVQWSEGAVDQTDGRLVMSAQLPPPGSLAVGYAVADIRVSGEREVTLDIDGDDAFRVWLNEKMISEKIANFESRKDCIAEDKGLKITLKDGTNRFLVKSANIDHKWWVRLRLTDANGSPIHFTAQ